MTIKKVLITGFSPPQCGRPTRTKYEHISDLWIKALEAGGVQVDQMRTEPGLDLTQYDAALVGLIPPNSIAGRYLYTALDVIARAKDSGCALLYYVDDWRFSQITSGVKSFTKRPEHFAQNAMFQQRWHRPWAQEHGWDLVLKASKMLRDDEWPTTLIPAFTWGDYKRLPKLVNAPNKLIIDPSAFAREYQIDQLPDDERRENWIMGTFSDQHDWINEQELTWPTGYVGTRRAKAERGHLPEADLVASYGKNWGVMGAPYHHAGSGWWRNRFVYAAKAGAIMLADPREVAGLEGYHVAGKDVERMNIASRREHANHQADLMLGSFTSASLVTEAILNVIKHEIAVQQPQSAVA